MTKQVSRREFLRYAAFGAAGVALSACAAPTPQVIKETQIVTQVATVEVPVEKTVVVQPTPEPVADPFQSVGSADVTGTVSWYLGGDDPFYQEIASAFMQEYPNIKINVMGTPWGQWVTRFVTMAAAGQMPDVAWFIAGHPGLRLDVSMWVDSLMDLSPFLPEIDQGDLINQSLLDACMFDGKLKGLPYEFNNIVLFYNKDMFDEAGLDYPDETWTWEDVIEKGKALTKADGSQYGLRIEQFEEVIHLEQAGTRQFADDMSESNYHKPEARVAYEHFYNIYVTSGIAPKPGEEGGYSLDAGTVAMTYHGNWMFGTYKGAGINFGSAVLPKGPAGGFTLQRENIWGVAKNTPNPAAALTFAKWLGLGRGLDMWAATGRLAPYKRFTVDSYVKATGSAGTPYEGAFRELMANVMAGAAYAKPAQKLPPFADNNAIDAIINNEKYLLLTEQSQDIDTTLKNIKTKLDEYLAAGWEQPE